MINSVFEIQFDPLLPDIWVIGLGAFGFTYQPALFL